MSKVELDPITSGYNLSKINANFQKLEDELNNNVLYRQDNPGEPNHMSTTLDMNSHRVLNLPDAVAESEPVTLRQLIAVDSGEALELRADLAAADGSSLVGFIQAGAGAVPRAAQDKMRELISPQDFGAVGDGAADDTAGFAALEVANAGRSVDLDGKTYVVSAIPVGNKYRNGSFKVGSIVYRTPSLNGILSGSQQGYGGGSGTGSGVDPVYTGGVLHLPTVSGRSTDDFYALMASQNCVSEGPARGINIGSIYSWAKGNVSGNYSARHSLAWVPQSANIASEECRVAGGFRGANLASIYSSCENESNANIACRNSAAASRNGANFASDGSYTGRGVKAILIANVSGGTLTSVSIAIGNDGVTTFPGVGYQVGDPLVFFDTLASSPVLPVVSVGSVDANGAITGFNYTSMGSGMTDGGVNVKVDNGTGDFSANMASVACKAEGLVSTNVAQGNSKASGSGSGNYSGDSNTASGEHSATLAANNSTASGNRSSAVSSSGSIASGILAVTLGANICEAAADGAVVTGRRTINNVIRSFALGDGGSGAASTANRKVHMLANGNLQIAGTLSQNQIFTDIAKMFENTEPVAIPVGAIVAWEGRKVRLATPDDTDFSVHSRTYSILLGDSKFTWANRYLTGEFGEYLMGEVWDEEASWDPELNDGQGGYVGGYVQGKLENPEFDISLEQTPRSERRDEWTPVALVGEVHTRVDASVAVGDYVCPVSAGVGGKSNDRTNLRCMEIRQQFDAGKGYAVALCLVK